MHPPFDEAVEACAVQQPARQHPEQHGDALAYGQDEHRRHEVRQECNDAARCIGKVRADSCGHGQPFPWERGRVARAYAADDERTTWSASALAR